MKLTPQKLAALYRAIRMFPPFHARHLPDNVKFKVGRSKFLMGLYENECEGHEITVSTYFCDTLPKVIETLAHEMCHLALERKGCGDHMYHDAEFNALAAEVCNSLGFNFKEF